MKALILMLSLLVVENAAAQQHKGPIHVTGRVSAAFQMEAVSTYSRTGNSSRVEQDGPAALRLTVQPSVVRTKEPQIAVIVLALRTNASSFQLVAASPEASGSAEITLTAIGPSGTGALVAPDAASSFLSSAGQALTADGLVVARGKRISLGGRFPSPDNALLVELKWVSRADTPSSFLLRIEP